VSEDQFPAFGAGGYTNRTEKIGFRTATDRVYFGVYTITSFQQLTSSPPKYLLIAEDSLIREMIDNEIAQQTRDPSRSNIPLFFARNEDFKVLELRVDGGIQDFTRIRLQNIKVVARAK
jgi:hypothetical protein